MDALFQPATSPLGRMELLALSDDLVVLVARQIRSHVFMCRFFQTCKRALATSRSIEELRITSHFNAACGWSSGDRVSMLVPSSWSARLVNLKTLTVDALTLSGAARLMNHLRSWPRLEQLYLGVDVEVHRKEDDGYEDGADMVEFVHDLARALRTGFIQLPALKRLSVRGLWGEA